MPTKSRTTKLEINPKVGNTYAPPKYVLTIILQFLMYIILYNENFGRNFANNTSGDVQIKNYWIY